ncbi:MAG: T9SS type A sorting domain-containing protein [Janthinobacterium lividum]
MATLSSIIVRTYQTAISSTTPQQSFSLSTLLTLTTLSTDTTMLTFPVGMPFDEVEITASDLLNLRYNIDVFNAFGTATPLPVVLTAFQGRATATGVALTWATASEYQANYFEVQRATGTPGAFAAIDRVPCTGSRTQAQHYHYQDAGASGVTYYRLRQVDFDGREVFSPVVTVEVTPATPELVVYPTRTTTQLTVVAPVGTQLGIFDQLGRQWQHVTSATAQPLDVRSLPSGVYFVRDLATGKSTRFVKVASELQP